jgi:hypothetical protein
MRFRALSALVLVLTLGLKVVPCEALDARSAHECCDAECPDQLTEPGHDGHAASPEAAAACCAASEQRRQQQDNRVLSTLAAVAPPDIDSTRFLVPAPARDGVHQESPPPAAPATGLYVLFSVFRL